MSITMSSYNLQKVSKGARKVLVKHTMDKLLKNGKWKFMYFHYNARNIMTINDTEDFLEEKEEMLNTGELDYNPENSPFNYDEIKYKISKTTTLILKPHRYIYKDENVNPGLDCLSWELEGFINNGGFTYYEFVRIERK